MNSVALIEEGKIIVKGGKRLLPTYDVFDETRYFEPAQESLIFELDGKKFGVTICEDTWNFGDFVGVPFYEQNPGGIEPHSILGKSRVCGIFLKSKSQGHRAPLDFR